MQGCKQKIVGAGLQTENYVQGYKQKTRCRVTNRNYVQGYRQKTRCRVTNRKLRAGLQNPATCPRHWLTYSPHCDPILRRYFILSISSFISTWRFSLFHKPSLKFSGGFACFPVRPVATNKRAFYLMNTTNSGAQVPVESCMPPPPPAFGFFVGSATPQLKMVFDANVYLL